MYSRDLFEPLCADKIVWIKTRTKKAQALFYNDSRHIGSCAFHETLDPIQLRLSGWVGNNWVGMVYKYWTKDVIKSISNFVTKNVSMKVNTIVYEDTNARWSIDNIKNELRITGIDITITLDDKSNETINVNMGNLDKFLKSIDFESDYENLNLKTTRILKGRPYPFNAKLPPNNWLKSLHGGKRRSRRSKSRGARRRTHRKN